MCFWLLANLISAIQLVHFHEQKLNPDSSAIEGQTSTYIPASHGQYEKKKYNEKSYPADIIQLAFWLSDSYAMLFLHKNLNCL